MDDPRAQGKAAVAQAAYIQASDMFQEAPTKVPQSHIINEGKRNATFFFFED